MDIRSLISVNNSLEMVPSNSLEMVFSSSSSDSMAEQKETQHEDGTLTELSQKKMKWTPEEDKILAPYGLQRDWKGAAAYLAGRTAKACERHWDELKKRMTTKEKKQEDKPLIEFIRSKKVKKADFSDLKDRVGSLNINNSSETVPSSSSSDSTAPQEEIQQEDRTLIEFIQKKVKEGVAAPTLTRQPSKKWIPEEDNVLAQYGPQKDWKGAAAHLAGRTAKACKKHWYECLKPSSEIPSERLRKWIPEEDNVLAQYGPQKDWKGAAAQLAGRTAKACKMHWYECLKPSSEIPSERLSGKRKWTPEEENVLAQYGPQKDWKGAAAQLAGRTAKACARHWEDYLRLSSEIPSERLSGKRKVDEDKTGLEPASKKARMAGSSELKDPLKEVQEPNWPQYELAVQHFQSIDLDDGLLKSFQDGAGEFLKAAQAAYEQAKQKSEAQEDCRELVERLQFAVSGVKDRIVLYETVYQHFTGFQSDPEKKEWMISHSKEFSMLYCNLLGGSIDQSRFESQAASKEIQYLEFWVLKS